MQATWMHVHVYEVSTATPKNFFMLSNVILGSNKQSYSRAVIKSRHPVLIPIASNYSQNEQRYSTYSQILKLTVKDNKHQEDFLCFMTHYFSCGADSFKA